MNTKVFLVRHVSTGTVREVVEVRRTVSTSTLTRRGTRPGMPSYSFSTGEPINVGKGPDEFVCMGGELYRRV